MDAIEIPDDLRRFLKVHTLTVPAVEALLIFRTAREQSWDARRLAARLYVTPERAASLLMQLEAIGAVGRLPEDQGHVYAPGTPEIAAVLDLLEFWYTRHLVAVTELIHSVEARAVQGFADAFRLRKDK